MLRGLDLKVTLPGTKMVTWIAWPRFRMTMSLPNTKHEDVPLPYRLVPGSVKDLTDLMTERHQDGS